jgi:hypothetical protein
MKQDKDAQTAMLAVLMAGGLLLPVILVILVGSVAFPP